VDFKSTHLIIINLLIISFDKKYDIISHGGDKMPNDTENNSSKNEFQDLLSEKKKENRFSMKKIYLLSTIGVLLLISALILFFVFSGKKYELTLSYSIPNTDIIEDIQKIKVSISGKTNFIKEYGLNDPITIPKLKEDNYSIEVSAINSKNYIVFSKKESVFIKDKTSKDFFLSREQVLYDLKPVKIGDDLLVNLPAGFDKYLVYTKNNGKFEFSYETSINTISLKGFTDLSKDVKFSVLKDSRLYEFSDSLSLSSLVPPLPPKIISPENNELIISTNYFFVWQPASLDSAGLTYDVYLKQGDETEFKVAENIKDLMYEYKKLSPGKTYTLKVVVKNSFGQSAQSIAMFKTASAEKDQEYLFAPSGKMGVTIYEVKDPKKPTELSSIKLDGNVTDVIKKDNYLYILRDQSGFTIADIKDLKNPAIKKNVDVKDINGIKIVDNYLFARVDGDKVYVYSLKDSYVSPVYLGETSIKYYGSSKPVIQYVEKVIEKTATPVAIKVSIISSEYPINIDYKNKVYITEFSMIVQSDKAKNLISSDSARVVETLRMILWKKTREDFSNSTRFGVILEQIKSGVNETFKLSESDGVKTVTMKISKFE